MHFQKFAMDLRMMLTCIIFIIILHDNFVCFFLLVSLKNVRQQQQHQENSDTAYET